ncbi:hypothetical protein MMC20_001271, partial [Loxospora ochrophaea]|nr:hypothetical protein [Loxospora ochrophaea]
MGHKEKKTISTSGIFKIREPTQTITKKIVQPAKAGKNKIAKTRHSSPEHELVTRFSGLSQDLLQRCLNLILINLDNIENSRNCILENADTAIESVYNDFTKHLSASSSSSVTLLEEASRSREKICQPLEDEVLQFTTDDGKVAGTTTFGSRMRRFTKIVATEKEELERLWKEWTDIEQKILDFSAEVLGPEGIQMAVKRSAGETQAYISQEQKETAQTIETERLRLEAEVKKMSQESIDEMQASEK